MCECGMECEIFSRVTGYIRPIKNWNRGKREEFKDRHAYSLVRAMTKTPHKNLETKERAAS